MKVVIMAGGKGTRISSIASDIPKPMIKVNGIPILEREVECLREQGFTDLIFTVGHLGSNIIDYFGDGSKISPITHKPFGVNIEYYFENTPLGNAGALFKIKDKLTEDFLLLNGDAVFDIDFNRIVKYHKEKGGLVTLFVHPNSHPFDSGIVITDENNSVIEWLSKEDKRPQWVHNLVNAGIHVISPILLSQRNDNQKIDLDRDLLKPLCGTGKMFAYHSPEYVKDMGTPDRYYSVCDDLKKRLPEKKNLRNKQKAIFLDRDGTVNKYVGFLTNIEKFELIDGVCEAIKKINQSDYLAIIVTNQPVIARGDITFKQLDEIHKKMETLLGNCGAYLDDIYFCPHHPDKGFEGEVTELKIKCDCRKPNIGMLIKAAEKYNIDLSNSWIIGDSESDILCGINAKCKTAFIGEKDDINSKADIYSKSLLEAIDKILGR